MLRLEKIILFFVASIVGIPSISSAQVDIEYQVTTGISTSVKNTVFVAMPSGDLAAIIKSNTGTKLTEIHILTEASGYQNFGQQSGTALHETGDSWDFIALPNGNIACINKAGTGSNSTEVHILTAASGYQNFGQQTGTALHQTGADWEFVAMPGGNIIGIRKSGTGSKTTEIHTLTAASGYQNFGQQSGTALHETGDSWSFVAMQNGDIVAINTWGTGSKSIELHVLTAASGYQSFGRQTATALPESRERWDFAVLPDGDIAAIKLSKTDSGLVEVFRLDTNGFTEKPENIKKPVGDLRVSIKRIYAEEAGDIFDSDELRYQWWIDGTTDIFDLCHGCAKEPAAAGTGEISFPSNLKRLTASDVIALEIVDVDPGDNDEMIFRKMFTRSTPSGAGRWQTSVDGTSGNSMGLEFDGEYIIEYEVSGTAPSPPGKYRGTLTSIEVDDGTETGEDDLTVWYRVDDGQWTRFNAETHGMAEDSGTAIWNVNKSWDFEKDLYITIREEDPGYDTTIADIHMSGNKLGAAGRVYRSGADYRYWIRTRVEDTQSPPLPQGPTLVLKSIKVIAPSSAIEKDTAEALAETFSKSKSNPDKNTSDPQEIGIIASQAYLGSFVTDFLLSNDSISGSPDDVYITHNGIKIWPTDADDKELDAESPEQIINHRIPDWDKSHRIAIYDRDIGDDDIVAEFLFDPSKGNTGETVELMQFNGAAYRLTYEVEY